jgi:DNA-binding MarR family transcriptional regulator
MLMMHQALEATVPLNLRIVGERMDRTDQSLIAIRKILRSTELHGRELARAAGVTAAQIRVLQIVAEKSHATPKEISRRMGVSQPTMSSLLDRLESKSLVERHPSEVDRRQVDIVITEGGRDVIARAPDPLQQRYVKQFEALADWEQAMFVSVLERVATMLDASGIDASPVLHIGELDGRGGKQRE